MRTRTPGGIRGQQGAGEAGFRRWCPGGGHTGGRRPRFREPAAPIRPAEGVEGRLRTPPGRAGAGAGGDDGQDSTAQRSGRCGTPEATQAGEHDGCTSGQARSWASSVGRRSPGRGRRAGHPRSSADSDWSGRPGGPTGLGHAGAAPCGARPGCRRRPPLVPTDSGIRRSGRSCCTSARNRPRTSFARAWTATKEDERAGRHAVRAAETPAAGTRRCTGGWEAKGRVQGCRTPPPDPPADVGGGPRPAG